MKTLSISIIGTIVLMAMTSDGIYAEPIVAMWTGSGDGANYADPANWDIGAVPINTNDDIYHVVIPAGAAVNFNIGGPSLQINRLTLRDSSLLQFNPGFELEVVELASTSGLVRVLGGSLLAPTDSMSEFTGSRARLEASGGGRITHGGLIYDIVGVQGTAISAIGAGTLIDLSTLHEIRSNVPAGGVSFEKNIVALSNARIDLSELRSISFAGYQLNIRAESGGAVDLSRLDRIDSGAVNINVDTLNYTLPKLAEASNLSISFPGGGQVGLPEIWTQMGGNYLIPAAGKLSVPKLSTMRNTRVTLNTGSIFDAPLLTDIAGSTIELGANQTLNVGSLGEIDNAKLIISGGVQFDRVTDSFYDLRAVVGPVLSATGDATVLDVSSVQEINANSGLGFGPARLIRATSHAHVNLSGLRTITGAPLGDFNSRLEFVAQSGGTIDLSGLQQITGGVVYFAVDAETFSLPKLASVSAMFVTFPTNGVLNMPELQLQSGGSYTVPVGATVNAPKLTTLQNTTISINTGGAFNAALLTDVAGSTLTVGANQTLSIGMLGAIDNAKISVTGGITFAKVVDSTYDIRQIAGSVISAVDPNTLLSLSSVHEINAASQTNVPRVISAASEARIDLSSLQAVSAGNNAESRLEFVAESGGNIDITSLQHLAAGRVHFTARSGGHIDLKGLAGPAIVTLVADGVASRIHTADAITLEPSSTLTLTAGATLNVGDYITYAIADEARFDADGGAIHMNGQQPQTFEVAGADLGEMQAANNFGLGRLVVGDDGVKSQVTLVDFVDNGNRQSSEALYLLGMGGGDGLSILGGSTLVIGNINAYAFIAGQLLSLRDLFDPGEQIIPFDHGFLSLSPIGPINGDYDRDGDVDGADFLEWQREFGTDVTAFAGADGNGNGTVDAADYVVWRDNFGTAASASQQAVPEPRTELLLLSLLGLTAAMSGHFKRRGHRDAHRLVP